MPETNSFNYACLRVAGPDAASYLQAQLSNDITSNSYTALLKPTALIIALAYLIRQEQGYFLLTAQEQSQSAFEHLSRFVITEDLQISQLKPDSYPESLLGAIPQDLVLEPVSAGDSLIKLDLVSKYVSFTKGCFPGQEALAKYKNLGLAKRKERSLRYLDEARHLHVESETASAEALELLRKAIKEDPSNEDAYEALGVLQARQKDYSGAIKTFQQLEFLNPQAMMAKTNLSILYLKIGDKDKAEQYKSEATLLQFQAHT